VQDVGGGRVIGKDSLGACPMDLKYEHINFVNFEVGLSTYKGDCTPSEGKVRLVEGKGVIFCKFPVELKTSYIAPLNILLNYGYSTSATRTVQISNPPGTSAKLPGTI
jgi:hypothetical protein